MRVGDAVAFHLTAELERRDFSLCEYEVGQWFWARLREAFPEAFGACLMPDHPHVVTPLDDPDAARMRLNRLLGQLARRLGVRYVGCAADPAPIRDLAKLQRDLRYVGLNAPRERLVDDPLGWLFSTHRDVVVATVDPWVTADRLARALRRPRFDFALRYHRYVSSDPDVRVDGTPFPEPALSTDLPTAPLGRIAIAVAAATRTRPEAIRRTGPSRVLFVALAHEQGWRNPTQLARACDTTVSAIHKIAKRIDPEALAPARLCLGDRRLRQGVPGWSSTSTREQRASRRRRAA